MRYFYFLLTVVTLLLISCGKEKLNEKTITMESNQELIKKYFSYFNQHAWTEMANLYPQTAEFKDPSLGSGILNNPDRKSLINIQSSTKYSPTYMMK